MDYKKKVAEVIKSKVDIELEAIEKLIEIPPQAEMGDYAFPCFQLAKIFRRDPNIIAKELKDKINQDSFKKVENLGAYINFFIDKSGLIKNTLEKILSEGDNYGSSNIGEGKTICIEYSSPNIGKPFHVGDLFSTLIGNSLYQLFTKEGYKVQRLNHLGDWGSKFGKLISAYKRWGNEEALERDSISELLRVYVKFHEEAQKDSLLEDEGRAYFKRLKEKDEEAEDLWMKFRDLSLREFEKIYDIFNIKFDSYLGEAFYDDKIEELFNELRERDILSESNGAQVVMLDKYNMPPCILLKDDEETIYAARDLVTAIYRKKNYDFYKCIYVTEAPESLYFKQIFKVLELLEYQWAKDCINVGFGLVKFKDRRNFTRKGEVVILEDLIKKSVDKILEGINENNPNLENKEEVAEKIAVGALIFTYLRSPREKNIIFDLKEILSFDGETGPYVQKLYGIAKGMLKRGGDIDIAPNFGKLNSKEELELVKILEEFTTVIHNATDKLEPSIMTRYIIEVANKFNKFYSVHSLLNLDDKELMKARLVLVEATCQVMKNALALIGIEVVEET
ncbi:MULTISPECIES: arginine--tRNA ligase [Clostridium]|uniref:Arginine--tRNA ligase n=1 Tax=Clostridium saudiense TaxID=1414720 RepID=A0ABS2FJM1_9CLOT|nr:MULTISPECIES: arginine--tRNA ligase [Clostridium]MBM6820098.1 arginine--tRNA ligase [Clostridium saudiense]